MKTNRLPQLIMCSSFLYLAGWGSCGGGSGTIELPIDGDPPPVSTCTDLGEDACLDRSDCQANYVGVGCACPECLPSPDGTGGCPPCDCPPPHDEFVGCSDKDPCAGLDEMSCVAAPECQPEYGVGPCPAGTNADGTDNTDRAIAPCDPSTGVGCGCTGDVSYLYCHLRDPVCGPVCAIYCEFGNKLDENGCPTCECNPPRSCYDLSEDQCIGTPGCRPIYYGADGTTDPSRPDDGTNGGGSGGFAPPCACPECVPGEACPPCDCGNGYGGCVPVSGCEGLDEYSCISDPRCEPIYGSEGCLVAPCEPDGTNCQPCDPVIRYHGCQDRPIHTGCCNSDYDCPGGYCADAFCDGPNCRPHADCVYPKCDDGTTLVCDALQPACGPGQVAAVQNGCWACVDARTCQGGGGGGQCDDGGPVFCDSLPPTCLQGTIPAARNGCWACVEPITCQEVTCHDGSFALCEIVPPVCAGGTSLAIVNSCYQCLAPDQCGTTNSCDDGTVVTCRALPPECPADQKVAVKNGCWACVDPTTCI